VPEVEVLDHVEVVAERTVAIPELHRISGGCDRDLLASNQIVPESAG
jgi:hypothetical protein